MSEESPLANEVVASDDGEASDSGGEGGVLVVPPPSRSVTVTEATVTTTSMAVISMAEEEVKEGADDEGDENSRLEEPGQDRIVREVSEEHGSRREKEKKKKHKHKHDREDKDEDEEERLRRRLIEKEKKRTSEKESHEKRKRRSTEGEAEDELFAMRPEADLKRQKEREAVERREREEKRREEGRRGGDERDDGRRGGSDRRDPKQAERDRHRRDERSGRGGGSAMERGGGGRGPPSRGDSGRGDARPGERRGDDRKHRRSSRSRSRSADRKKVRGDERRGGRDERERKKDSRTPPAYRDRRDDKDRKERGEKERRKSPPKEGAKKEETEKEKEQKMEVDEAVAVPAPAEQGGSDGERADTPSPLASTAAAADEAPPENPKDKQRFAWETKKYSKFDSSPESDQLMDSPKSDIILRPSSNEADSDIDRSDVEMDEEEVEEEEEEAVDLSGIPWDELTEEQRGRLSPDTRSSKQKEWQTRLVSALPVYYPGISGCRNVVEFDCMNRIEEGTFGVVYRAKDKRTDEVVALKRLKMEKEKEGFPITSLREVNMLLKAGGHENVVNVKEIVVGSNMDKIFLVMEFVEHDVKSLMDTMHRSGKKFSTGEVKTLTRQLLAGMEHLHGLWILHRDLKTSNLLLSHKSVLKIADFGLAREYGHPLKEYTQVVVTLWYRSPELLLGIKKYSTAVDMWSVGCIMAEFILLKPLFPGKGEIDQVNKIFTVLGNPEKLQELGTPNERVWPGYDELPGPKQVTFVQHSYNQLRKKFPASNLSQTGYFLLNSLLMYNPEKRVSATEALANEWFQEDPQPTAREMFPTWPAKSELHKKPPVDPAKKAAQEAAKKAQPAVQISREHAALFDNLNVKLDQAPKAFTLKF